MTRAGRGTVELASFSPTSIKPVFTNWKSTELAEKGGKGGGRGGAIFKLLKTYNNMKFQNYN